MRRTVQCGGVCGIVKRWADRQLELCQAPPLCFPPGLPALLGLGLLLAAAVHCSFDPFRGNVTRERSETMKGRDTRVEMLSHSGSKVSLRDDDAPDTKTERWKADSLLVQRLPPLCTGCQGDLQW